MLTYPCARVKADHTLPPLGARESRFTAIPRRGPLKRSLCCLDCLWREEGPRGIHHAALRVTEGARHIHRTIGAEALQLYCLHTLHV